MSAPTLSFVLPAHNEEGNVAAMAQRLTAILQPSAPTKSSSSTTARPTARWPRSARWRRPTGGCGSSRSSATSAIRSRCAQGSPRAGQRRDPDGLRLRASARTHSGADRALARGREGGGDPAQQPRAKRRRLQSARRRSSTTGCSRRCRTFRSNPAARISCCWIARPSRRSTPSTITTCSCAVWCAGSACRSRPSLHAGHAQRGRIELHVPPHDRPCGRSASSRTASALCASRSILRCCSRSRPSCCSSIRSSASSGSATRWPAGPRSCRRSRNLGAGQFLVLGIIGEYVGACCARPGAGRCT